MKKIFTLLALITILIIPQLGCNSQGNNLGVEKTSFHMDTSCRITIYSMSGVEEMSKKEQEQRAISLITDSYRLCDEYEKLLSKTIVGSDVYNINNAGGQAVEVDESTIEVIQKGIEYGDISQGAFDITIGEVTKLWDFSGADKEAGQVPDEKAIAEAVSHVNYKEVVIEGNTVKLLDPEAEIDLGGIAKGYVADRVADYLESQGVTSGVVSLGGNIVVIGQKGKALDNSSGTEFSIGIRDPFEESGTELLGVLACEDKTVVTSGTYERYFEIDEKRYHHVLNPKTGYPFETDLVSVTIIAPKGHSVDCDGLSTTCLTLGSEKAIELLRSKEGVEGILVDVNGKITMSDDNLKFEKN